MDLDVADCLARVREQDQDAARLLVGHLYPVVAAIIRRNLPRRASEEDLAQEIFSKVFAKLDQYESAAPLEHWVSRIAVNHCLNAMRSQGARPEWRMADLSEEQAATLEAVANGGGAEPTPGQAASSAEIVERLLAALGPEDRLVIRMLELEEIPIQEIQAVTGWSATRIRVRAFRARRKLNKLFGELRRKGNL